jgi:hypothetical protein
MRTVVGLVRSTVIGEIPYLHRPANRFNHFFCLSPSLHQFFTSRAHTMLIQGARVYLEVDDDQPSALLETVAYMGNVLYWAFLLLE